MRWNGRMFTASGSSNRPDTDRSRQRSRSCTVTSTSWRNPRGTCSRRCARSRHSSGACPAPIRATSPTSGAALRTSAQITARGAQRRRAQATAAFSASTAVPSLSCSTRTSTRWPTLTLANHRAPVGHAPSFVSAEFSKRPPKRHVMFHRLLVGVNLRVRSFRKPARAHRRARSGEDVTWSLVLVCH